MDWETIHKETAPVVPPRLTDYERARSMFSWARARSALAGLPCGGLNIAHKAVDRHAASDRADEVALRCVARDDAVTDVSYAELARRTAASRTRCGHSASATATGCSHCSAAAPSSTPRCWAR